MKLKHALKIISEIDRSKFTQDQRIAFDVVQTMITRILDTRPSLRALVRAIYGEDMNQTELDELFKQQE
jgi:hypothetical protein